ncbi:beta-lactamase/transpeptidase-like protein [Xylariaceae sp. FL0662B]|nr:beta-lactamase/transpeptidase-like protein [Xylariaceae sp. FL0662B]
MAQNIDKVYEEAVESGLLPGVSLLAGDRDGNVIYSKSLGRATTKEAHDLPFTSDTICSIASMSKLMTSVAVLQCVEDKVLDLDTDVRPDLPEMGKYGIITSFDDETGATFVPDATPVTLRMLLTHTSGHEYDWINGLLIEWRASRNEEPWTGPTVEHKSVLPLVFPPGSGFAYGAGHDWAGKIIQLKTGLSLEDFMRARIWTPLGIENEATFWPKTRENMQNRTADLSTLDENGIPPAVDAPDFDMGRGATECMGGAGVYASTKAYYTFLSAVLRRDPRLLTPSSYTELFRPQLDENCEQALNDYLVLSPIHMNLLGLRVPPTVRKSWSLAGLVAKDGQEGRFEPGTTLWAGLANTVWFIDHKAGICGTAFCQILPPMHPPVIALHEQFQRGVLQEAKKGNCYFNSSPIQ